MLRYRILRDLSNRDGDAMIVPYIVAGETWACGICSEESGEDDRACWFCHNTRGDYVCDCGHKNPKDAQECESCGREKPEGD